MTSPRAREPQDSSTICRQMKENGGYESLATDGSTPELDLEAIIEGEWLDWYRLTPAQRWSESQKLWATYLALGGSLEPEPDTQSPFFDPDDVPTSAARGRGLRVIRRSPV